MNTKTIKTKFERVSLLTGMATALTMVSGCVVEVSPDGEAPPPTVVVAAPAVVEVPDYYAWDGYEYVGVVGVNYFYLGPDHVWLACDSVRVERFHAWAGYHPDWRDHATFNVNYRTDAHGNFHPVRQGGARPDIHQNGHPAGHVGVEGQPPGPHGNGQPPGHGGPQKKKAAPKKHDDKNNGDQH